MTERDSSRIAPPARVEYVAHPSAGEILARVAAEVKEQLPVWKRQVFADGTDEWVACP